MSKKLKNLIVNEFETKFKNSDGVLVVDIKKFNAVSSNEVRKELRQKDIKIAFVANNLAKIALKNVGLNEANDYISGTSAVLYGEKGKMIDIAKVSVELSKRFSKKFIIKGGCFEGKTLDIKSVESLAKLPNKKEMQAIVLTTILSPAVAVLNLVNNMLSVANTLATNHIQQKDQETKQIEEA